MEHGIYCIQLSQPKRRDWPKLLRHSRQRTSPTPRASGDTSTLSTKPSSRANTHRQVRTLASSQRIRYSASLTFNPPSMSLLPSVLVPSLHRRYLSLASRGCRSPPSTGTMLWAPLKGPVLVAQRCSSWSPKRMGAPVSWGRPLPFGLWAFCTAKPVHKGSSPHHADITSRGWPNPATVRSTRTEYSGRKPGLPRRKAEPPRTRK